MLENIASTSTVQCIRSKNKLVKPATFASACKSASWVGYKIRTSRFDQHLTIRQVQHGRRTEIVEWRSVQNNDCQPCRTSFRSLNIGSIIFDPSKEPSATMAKTGLGYVWYHAPWISLKRTSHGVPMPSLDNHTAARWFRETTQWIIYTSLTLSSFLNPKQLK